MDKKIVEIASQLIKRLGEFNDHQSQIKNLKATIANPKNHDRVSRRVTVNATTENVPREVTLWQVVEASGKYHPEAPITTRNWKNVTTIGMKGFGASDNDDFSIHLIATTRTANDKFTSYLAEQQKLKLWHGLTLPAGTRILATTTVRRDDYAVALADLVGTYDEYRAKPLQPTNGIITVDVTPHAHPTITATSDAGNTVWAGTITLNRTTGKATATYQHKQAPGQGTLEFNKTGDEITVVGKDNTAPAKPFHMVWKKRP